MQIRMSPFLGGIRAASLTTRRHAIVCKMTNAWSQLTPSPALNQALRASGRELYFYSRYGRDETEQKMEIGGFAVSSLVVVRLLSRPQRQQAYGCGQKLSGRFPAMKV